MKDYEVGITETRTRTVTVEAEDSLEARDIAEVNWLNGYYALGDADFQDVSFLVKKEPIGARDSFGG